MRREYRSPSMLIAGAASAAGAIRTIAATPTAVAPPTSYAYTASAMKNVQPPSELAAHAVCSRRSDRVPSASRSAHPATLKALNPDKARLYSQERRRS